jgi:ERCC4-related helicase
MVQVQQVVFNLLISKIVARSDTDPDVAKYKFSRIEDVVKVRLPPAYDNLTRRFLMLMEQPLSQLRKLRIMNKCTAASVNMNTINMAREHSRRSLPEGIHPHSRGRIMGLLSLMQSLVNAKKMLSGYGLLSFYDSICKMQELARQGDDLRRHLVSSPIFTQLKRSIDTMVATGAMVRGDDRICLSRFRLHIHTHTHNIRYIRNSPRPSRS